jgi:hypothetical protein
LDEALDLLDLRELPDEAAARRAYRSRLRETHPDVNGAADATERTVRITAAFRVVLAQLAQPARPEQPPGSAAAPAPPAPSDPEPSAEPTPAVELVDAETVGIDAPAQEVLPMLIDAAHRLGDITYLDPGAGLLEVVVEFVGAPTSSVVLSLQGRATGLTEVFCSVEPLSGGDAPPADAVTQLLLRTLRGEDPAA